MRRTYPTRCFKCNAPVFYHTNGYGDCVFLDALTGAPWPVHECWAQRTRPKRDATNEPEARFQELTLAKEIAAGSRPIMVRRLAGESTVDRIVRENEAKRRAMRDYRELNSSLRLQRLRRDGR